MCPATRTTRPDDFRGFLNAERIWQYFANTHDYFIREMQAELQEPMQWLENQDGWVREQVSKTENMLTGQGNSAGQARQHCLGRLGEQEKLSLTWFQVSQRGELTYWKMLGLVLKQFDGIVAGYQDRQAQTGSSLPYMSRHDFIFVNGNGAGPEKTSKQHTSFASALLPCLTRRAILEHVI